MSKHQNLECDCYANKHQDRTIQMGFDFQTKSVILSVFKKQNAILSLFLKIIKINKNLHGTAMRIGAVYIVVTWYSGREMRVIHQFWLYPTAVEGWHKIFPYHTEGMGKCPN